MTPISTFGRRLIALPGLSSLITLMGLGTAAFKDTGTSGNTVPLLDGTNTWSGNQTWSAGGRFDGTFGVGRPGVATGGLYFNRDPDNPFILMSYGTTPGTTIGQFRASGASGIIGIADAVGGTFGISYNPTTSVIRVTGCLARGTVVTKTANFTVADTENWLINNKSGSACVVTLPTASSFPGRELMFKNHQAQQLNSASSNVVPLAGGAAGTAILSANAGRWATLVSDGTNWQIMAGVV